MSWEEEGSLAFSSPGPSWRPSCPLPGFLWFECKEVWIEGLRSYLLDWWNFLDVVILSLYLASFALRLLLAGLAYMHCRDASDSTTCRYFTTAGEEPVLIAFPFAVIKCPAKQLQIGSVYLGLLFEETQYLLVRKMWWVRKQPVTVVIKQRDEQVLRVLLSLYYSQSRSPVTFRVGLTS